MSNYVITQRQYRQAALKDHKPKIHVYDKARYNLQKAFINRYKMQPCFDCHIQYAPWIMQFDHRIPNEKKFMISQMFRKNRALIKTEIGKCDVVCANCHMQRTHLQQNAII